MYRLAFVVFAVAIAFGAFTIKPKAEIERSHEKWLFDKYVEATSIKEGMTRGQFNKLFVMDGGLQRIPAERYVLKGTDLIKVDVEFEIPAGFAPSRCDDEPSFDLRCSTMKIKRISQPYLEPFNYD